jgi:hypothetical protein
MEPECFIIYINGNFKFEEEEFGITIVKIKY